MIMIASAARGAVIGRIYSLIAVTSVTGAATASGVGAGAVTAVSPQGGAGLAAYGVVTTTVLRDSHTRAVVDSNEATPRAPTPGPAEPHHAAEYL